MEKTRPPYWASHESLFFLRQSRVPIYLPLVDMLQSNEKIDTLEVGNTTVLRVTIDEFDEHLLFFPFLDDGDSQAFPFD